MAVDEPEPYEPARWATRIGAWLIDVVLLSAVIGVIGDLLGLVPGVAARFGDPVVLGRFGLLLFVYWTVFEWRTGQSPGKLVLDIRVITTDGEPLSFLDAAIESFGKAFLLPLDVAIGVLVMPGDRLRLFNRLSNTVVVDIDEPDRPNRATATTA